MKNNFIKHLGQWQKHGRTSRPAASRSLMREGQMKTGRAVGKQKTMCRSSFSGSPLLNLLPSIPVLRGKGRPGATIQQLWCSGGNKANMKQRRFCSLKSNSHPRNSGLPDSFPSSHITPQSAPDWHLDEESFLWSRINLANLSDLDAAEISSLKLRTGHEQTSLCEFIFN